MNSDHTLHLKQPKVFPFSVGTALFERSGFYALAFVLVMFVKETYKISDHEAFVLFGVFNALVFLTPAVGGYLADNIFGIRRTMLLGLCIETVGLMCLALPTEKLLYFSLSCIILGIGFFKVGPTDLMGRSYHKNDPRIDNGFTFYYMAMNIGASISPIAIGYLQRYYGWHIAFIFATAVMLAGIATYFILRHRASEFDVEVSKHKVSRKNAYLLTVGTVAACGVCVFLLKYTIVANISFIVATACLLFYFLNEIRKSPKKEQLEIIACLILIFIGMVFFVMYFQLFMSLELYIKRVVSHNLFGFDIPASAFLSLNNIWVVILSPILVFIYNLLTKHNKSVAITSKFSFGLLTIGLCFITLYVSTFFHDSSWQVSSIWVVIAIMLFSLGELLVSALGVAMVTRIAPKRLFGVMMGAWFLIASSLASAISSSIASLASVPDNIPNMQDALTIYGKAFLEMGMIGIVGAIIVFLVGPSIKRMADIK